MDLPFHQHGTLRRRSFRRLRQKANISTSILNERPRLPLTKTQSQLQIYNQTCNLVTFQSKIELTEFQDKKKQYFTAITSLSTNQYQQKLTIGKKMWVINGAMKYNKVKCFFYLFDFKFSRGPYCPSSLPSNWSRISNA